MTSIRDPAAPVAEKLTRRSIASAALFAVVAGIDGLGTSVAFATLIFAGALSAGLGMGFGVILLSSVILAVFIALRSRYPASVAQVQETSIAILASAVATATATMTDQPDEIRLATAFAILAACTTGAGVLFWLFGRFRFGTLVRFFPYPVVAGFLAGSGWLLIQGALMLQTGQEGLLQVAASLTQPDMLLRLLPAVLFAVVLAVGLRRSPSPLVPPVAMVLAVGLFYVGLLLGGVPVEAARASGWLPQLHGSTGLSIPSPLWIVQTADWHVVATALPAMLSIALIAMAGVLLNTSGLEVAVGREIDANTELKVAGQANILAGVFGGASGFTGLGMTLLARRLGAKGRTAGLATAAVTALALPFATEIAGAVPIFLAVGLMLVLGGELLHDWIFVTRRQMPLLEWLVVLAIPLSMMAFGFMAGMAIGLGFSVIAFVYNYARLPVIRLVASGRERRSSVDRSAAASHILDEDGRQVHVLELQGFVFFGTAEQVVGAVRRRLDAAAERPRFVIIDFAHVSGMDSAAAAGFVKIANMLAVDKVGLTLSGLSPSLRRLLADSVFTGETAAIEAPDLDHALEACEERLLQDHAGFHEPEDILLQLRRALGNHPRVGDLIAAMERMELQAGTQLIVAGEQATDVYLLAEGRVKVQVALGNGRTVRLRTMASGAVLGEVALYLGGRRTADVIVERSAVLYRLGKADLERLEHTDSTLAVLAHRLFAIALAERLTVANRMLQLSLA